MSKIYENQCYKCNQSFKHTEILDTTAVSTGENSFEEVVYCKKCIARWKREHKEIRNKLYQEAINIFGVDSFKGVGNLYGSVPDTLPENMIFINPFKEEE